MAVTTQRVARVLAGLAVTCGTLAATTSASAYELKVPAKFAVYGSLTDKKLNEKVVLPKGSSFTGLVNITNIAEGEFFAKLSGNLSVPPWTASLKVAGVVPVTTDLTLTEVGESGGTISAAPPAECAHDRIGGECVTIAVKSKAILGITAAGVAGVELPTHCVTSEPLELALRTTETSPSLQHETHFTGTATIPSLTCEGLQGPVVALALTTAMSGPENPYAIGLAPNEPTPPAVLTRPPSRVTQIAAHLNGNADPSGEPITSCTFEYGTSTSYGTSVPCNAKPPLESTGTVDEETVFVTGLSEGVTYHYRIVATNSLGTSYGADKAFTTPAGSNGATWGKCVAQKHGEYKDPGCEEKSKKPGKGKFEWKPGPAQPCFAMAKGEYTDSSCTVKSARRHKGSFEKEAGPAFTASTGTVTLEGPTLSSGKVTCAAGTGSGEVLSATRGVERLTFTGCESAAGQCISEGPNSTPGSPGVIVTNLLETRLLGPVIARGERQVWMELTSREHQPYLAEFGCGGTLSRIKGYVSGVQSGDVGTASATGTTTFALAPPNVHLAEQEVGEQELFTELSQNGGSSWSSAAASSVVMDVTSTAQLPTEVKR
jgi:hypothetical protein